MGLLGTLERVGGEGGGEGKLLSETCRDFWLGVASIGAD